MREDKQKSRAGNGYILRHLRGILNEEEYKEAKKRTDEIEREFEGLAR